MNKGRFTLFVTMGIAVTAFFFEGDTRSLIFTIGVTGVVGCGTNALAIRMLFDRIYLLPWRKKWPLPFSGVLEIKRYDVAAALGWTVSRRLVTPEVITRTVKSPSFQCMIRSAIDNKLNQITDDLAVFKLLMDEVEKSLLAFVDSAVFRQSLQQNIYNRMGWFGEIIIGIKNLREKEKVTPQVQREVKKIVTYLCEDQGFRNALRQLLATLPEKYLTTDSPLKTNIQEHSGHLFRDLLEKTQLDKIVAEEVATFPPGELGNMVVKITSENLYWLEVWGGFLGALGGGIFWFIARWL